MNTMRPTTRQIDTFQQKIFTWWKSHKRDLPWRHTRDAYKIFVSEVMLQQTQVSRALPKYEEFLHAFPDVSALARASVADVLRVWKGMGYNRRALYMREAAKSVVAYHKGQFPTNEHDLCALSGLGRYTARAILVFAYEQDVAMVDTNIRQILVHEFFSDVPQKERIIEETADLVLPRGKSWDWHQALMDYGALELKNERPKVKKKSATVKRIPFRQTDRFFRGRIVDSLREKKMRSSDLIDSHVRLYRTKPESLARIIGKLKEDGLIEETNGYLTLAK